MSVGSLKHKISRLLVAFFISIAFIATQNFYQPITPAYSQVKKTKKRKNLFEILFGKRGSLRTKNKRKEQAKRANIRKLKLRKLKNRNSKRTKRRKKGKKPSNIRTAPKVEIVEKKKDAKKIMVAGDFMAGGLAWGLKQAYADNPDVVIVDVSNGLSGFVRNDVKNWPVEIVAHINKFKPALVVFLAGMNDRQQMALKSGRANKLSEPWLTAYNKRTQTLAKAVQANKLPMVWTGLPPVKSRNMSSDYLIFNAIFRTQVEAINGTYVDVWDGFTNAEGHYVSAGPNISGQIKRLRSADGINMNNTGKRKLAFYVKGAIRKLTGIGTSNFLVSLPGIEDERPITPQYDPAKTGKTIVYSLASPALDGGSKLDGLEGAVTDKKAKKSVSYDLVTSGQLPKTHPGRIDHYGVVSNEVKPAINKAGNTSNKAKAARNSKAKSKPAIPKS